MIEELYFAEANPLTAIRIANLATLGKKPNLDKKVSITLFQEQLLAEHSTLDFASLIIVAKWRSDVVNQLVRHTKHYPRFAAESKRPDWTGKPRPKDPAELRYFVSKWPLRALMAMAHERLCFKAMKETRETVEELRKELSFSSDVLLQTLAKSLVPMCVYRNGCPYKASCGFFGGHFTKFDRLVDIWSRYEVYDHIFKEAR